MNDKTVSINLAVLLACLRTEEGRSLLNWLARVASAKNVSSVAFVPEQKGSLELVTLKKNGG